MHCDALACIVIHWQALVHIDIHSPAVTFMLWYTGTHREILTNTDVHWHTLTYTDHTPTLTYIDIYW